MRCLWLIMLIAALMASRNDGLSSGTPRQTSPSVKDSKELDLIPKPPEKIFLWFRNETTLRLLWQPSGATNYTGYQVSVGPHRPEGTLQVERKTDPPHTSQVAFHHLLPGREYEILIQTVNGIRRSAPKSVRYRTVPMRVDNLTCDTSSLTSNSFKITWDPPPAGEFDTYYLMVQGTDTIIYRGRDDPNEWQFTDNILPGRNYSVQVVTVSGGVASSPAQVEVTTKPLPVRYLTAVADDRSATVIVYWWTSPSSVQDSFQVCYLHRMDRKCGHTGNKELALYDSLPNDISNITVRAISNSVESDDEFTSAVTTVDREVQREMNLSSTIKNFEDVLPTCPPLSSLTVHIACWRHQVPVPCEPARYPTRARYRCRRLHEPAAGPQPDWIKCQPNGTWSGPLPTCNPQCGHSNLPRFDIANRIVGGEVPQPGDLPWHAALYFLQEGTWEYLCGGTLVSPRLVLTAAHCVTQACYSCRPDRRSPDDVMVALGKIHRDWNISEATEVRRAVKNINIHPHYVGLPLNFDSDIALVELEGDVPVSDAVLPACVDHDRRHEQGLLSGQTVGLVSGWGHTEDCPHGDVCGVASETLMYRPTPVMDFDTCLRVIQQKKPSPLFQLTPDKLCSGNGTTSVIQSGDSGGGLVYRFADKYFVYGVVSARLKINDLYSFGAFTKVLNYRLWMRTVIKRLEQAPH